VKKIKHYKSSDIAFHIFNYLFMILLVIVTLYPFLNTIATSFNSGIDSVRGNIYLWPREFTLENYKAIFATGTIYGAFFISVARTVISVVFGVFLTTMISYTLSRKEFIFRKQITAFIVLTMYFNAGLIPVYFLIRSLGLINNFAVYIIPGLVSAFNMIVIRTYIQGLPESIIESARIDGANEMRILIRVVLPLCKPVLATIALFIAVGSWNSWFDTFLYASSVQELSTLQYELMKILSSALTSNATQAMASGGVNAQAIASKMVTPTSIRAAITIVAAVPILVVYPFLQKHFVTGLVVGGVKE
jgi:putative aldouronate transport system permease protein